MESEGWGRIIRLSAYEGMSGKGPLASWWERNCWRPLLSKQIGSGYTPPDPAPAGYLREPSPPAKRQRVEDAGLAAAGAAGAGSAATGNPAPKARPKKCANCGALGHMWWEACPVVLKPHLQTMLDASKGRGRGAPSGGAPNGGAGGGGNGGNGGGGARGGAGGGGRGAGGRVNRFNQGRR